MRTDPADPAPPPAHPPYTIHTINRSRPHVCLHVILKCQAQFDRWPYGAFLLGLGQRIGASLGINKGGDAAGARPALEYIPSPHDHSPVQHVPAGALLAKGPKGCTRSAGVGTRPPLCEPCSPSVWGFAAGARHQAQGKGQSPRATGPNQTEVCQRSIDINGPRRKSGGGGLTTVKCRRLRAAHIGHTSVGIGHMSQCCCSLWVPADLSNASATLGMGFVLFRAHKSAHNLCSAVHIAIFTSGCPRLASLLQQDARHNPLWAKAKGHRQPFHCPWQTIGRTSDVSQPLASVVSTSAAVVYPPTAVRRQSTAVGKPTTAAGRGEGGHESPFSESPPPPLLGCRARSLPTTDKPRMTGEGVQRTPKYVTQNDIRNALIILSGISWGARVPHHFIQTRRESPFLQPPLLDLSSVPARPCIFFRCGLFFLEVVFFLS